MKLVDFIELEVALKKETWFKIINLHRLINGNFGDRTNRRDLRDFEINSTEFNDNLLKTKTEFSLNDLISIFDVLSISCEGVIDELITRIVFCLCNFDTLKPNIMYTANSKLEDLFYIESSSELDPNKNRTGGKLGEGARNEKTVVNNDDMGNLAQSDTGSDKTNVCNADRRCDSGMYRNQMS